MSSAQGAFSNNSVCDGLEGIYNVFYGSLIYGIYEECNKFWSEEADDAWSQ